MAIRTCERPGCDRPHKAKGLCMNHYYQQWSATPEARERKRVANHEYYRTHLEQERERARRNHAKKAQQKEATA